MGGGGAGWILFCMYDHVSDDLSAEAWTLEFVFALQFLPFFVPERCI